MKYAVIFASKTGNTRSVANVIRETLAEDTCVCFGAWKPCAIEADVLFIGSWTDKGHFDEELQGFYSKLPHKRIALFGTAGFGGSSAYFDAIMERVKAELPKGVNVLGSFMCQGKMPIRIRKRYEQLQKEHPADEKIHAFIDNFDQALVHPNDQDLKEAQAFAEHVRAMLLE